MPKAFSPGTSLCVRMALRPGVARRTACRSPTLKLAEARGAESYRVIHAALVSALRASGINARLSAEMPPAAGGECFLQPVEHDVLDAAGRKLAGAGQRRTARGLLHQGSVAGSASHAEVLAEALADRVLKRDFEPDPGWLQETIATRYGSPPWHSRRSG